MKQVNVVIRSTENAIHSHVCASKQLITSHSDNNELKSLPMSKPSKDQKINSIDQSINQFFRSSIPKTTSSASPVTTFVEAKEACFLCALPFLLTTFKAGSSTLSVSSPNKKPRFRR